jgi:glycosyl-4,4'-diaponeurosporenoate acyltransferase
MRLVFPPDWLSVALPFLLWPALQLGAVALSRLPNRESVSSRAGLFLSRPWERGGAFYQRFLRVKAWKPLLPDGAAVSRKGYRKRNLSDFSRGNLERYLEESCRAELAHWLAIPPFILFGIFMPSAALLPMALYALLVNLPCIIAQRYNRPRIERILSRRPVRP